MRVFIGQPTYYTGRWKVQLSPLGSRDPHNGPRINKTALNDPRYDFPAKIINKSYRDR